MVEGAQYGSINNESDWKQTIAKAQQMKVGLTPQFSPKVTAIRNVNTADKELEELLARQRTTIKVIGCGGGGNNTVNRIT